MSLIRPVLTAFLTATFNASATIIIIKGKEIVSNLDGLFCII